MADRVDFYFRQRVTEAELDLAFALLEKADRDLAADLNIYGIVAGAVPAPHSPVPDLTVDLTAPARAYDNLGQRMFFGTGQTVDCAVDLVGIPTDVATVGNERWLGIFLRFKRLLSDPRTDGNSQQVFFRRDESFELVVRQAPEGAIGVAPKAALQADELLLCDVRRRPGQTQILVADLDTSRRQAFIFAQGSSVSSSPRSRLRCRPRSTRWTRSCATTSPRRHDGTPRPPSSTLRTASSAPPTCRRPSTRSSMTSRPAPWARPVPPASASTRRPVLRTRWPLAL
jgi:hypothetical protein